MSVMESQNDLDFVMPPQVEDNDLANQLQTNQVQCFQAGGNGTEEYDELRDVITADGETIWTTTAPTSSPSIVTSGNTATIIKNGGKHIYTTATIVEEVSNPTTHVVTVPHIPTRQPAKKRKAARPHNYNGDRKMGGRVQNDQEVLFSCDQCSVTFTDPQQAIKHISERHMAHMPSGDNQMDTMEIHESQVLVSLLNPTTHRLTLFAI